MEESRSSCQLGLRHGGKVEQLLLESRLLQLLLSDGHVQGGYIHLQGRVLPHEQDMGGGWSRKRGRWWMDWHPGGHRRQDILVNVARGGWWGAFGRWAGRKVAVCHFHGGGAVLGLDGNHLAHRAVVRLLELVDDELAVAARAMQHLESGHRSIASSEIVTG